MKPIFAYAIVHSGNEIDIYDRRVPVFWLKRVALAEMKHKSFSDSKVVRVEIRQAKRQMREGKA